MDTVRVAGRKQPPQDVRAQRRRRGVVAIPHDLERRLYFLAALVFTGWYLLDRLF